MPIKLGPTTFTTILDGNQISYSSETEFLVQISKTNNPKSGYETKRQFKGDLVKAVFCYNSFHVEHGYKKRLLMPSCNKKPILARQGS